MKYARFRMVLVVGAIVVAGFAVLLRIAFSPIGLGLALQSRGLHLASGTLKLGLSRSSGKNVVITSSKGEPLLTAEAFDAEYDLKSLASGKPHAFGLVALHLKRPVITIIRRSDGSWNLPDLGAGATSAPPGPGGVVLPPHLRFAATIEDGTVKIEQPQLLDTKARSLSVDHVTLAASVDTDGLSSYRLRAEVGAKPLTAQGGIDASQGLAVHRATVASLPIATLLNAAVDSKVFVVHSGTIGGLTFLAYGTGARGQAVLGDHMSAHARISNFSATVAGLEQPLNSVNGQIVLTDDAVTFDHTAGRLADMPFTASGAIFAFASPQLRIHADGTGDLHELRRLFSFSKDLPVHGRLTTHTTVEGPVSSPMVIVDVANSGVHYEGLPLALQPSTIVYDANAVDFAPVRFHYGDVAFSGGGTISVGDHVRPLIAVHATAPSASLPYLDGIFGGTTDAFVELGGIDSSLDGHAVIDGHDGSRRLRGLVHIDGSGEGVIGPVVLQEHGRTSILAGGALVRPKGVFVGIVHADDATVVRSHAVLPGVTLPVPPPVSGLLNGNLALAGDYHSFWMHGRAQARHLFFDDRYAADTADVAFGGDLRLLSIDRLDVHGPFGSLQLAGVAGTSGSDLTGEVQGDLGVLGRVFGRSDVSGTFELPISVQSDGHNVGVDVTDARFSGTRVGGIPLESFSGRVVIGNKLVTVAARARLDGGEVLAGGSLANGIGISASGLAGIGPVRGALLDAAAIVRGTVADPRATGVAMLQTLSVNGLPLGASTGFDADRHSVRVTGGLVQGPGIVAHVVGGVNDLAQGGVIALDARLTGASVATLAENLAPVSTAYYPQGSVDANIHIDGPLIAPHLLGTVVLPEGSIEGLAFRNAQTHIDASAKRMRFRHGSVTVGSTNVHLGGAFDGRNFRSYISAPYADLADFNNFFDQNNMLAGTGAIRVTAATGVNSVRTLADVDLRNVRVSSFALGTTQAHWRSQGRDINGSVGIDGLSGRLAVKGDLELAAKHPTEHLLSRSTVNLKGSASDLDLERWLPALGVTLPVTGRLDLAGNASGRLPKLTADLTIDARDATIGPVPIDDARAHLVARNGRGILQQAHVVVHGAVTDAAGSFGFAPTDSVAIALHAQAPDIGDLATSVVHALRSERATHLGLGYAGAQAEAVLAAMQPLNGNASTSLQVTGTMGKPHVVGALDIETAHVRGVSLPRVLASFALQGKKLNVTDAEIAFEKGDLTFAGSLPLVLQPLSIGPAGAPLSLDVSADAVDLRSFTGLLPPKSSLHGVLDGAIALEGTPASPQLFGELDLNGASFVSPLESVPIKDASSKLSLSGRSAKLVASATVGGGVFSLNGHAAVANLIAIGANTDYSLKASATHAQVDLASYGRGTVDANVTVSHTGDAVPRVDGSIALSDAQIPFSAFYNPSSGSSPVANSLFAKTQLHVTLIAGKNARVRSGSIDLGASGEATLGGTIGQPTLAGAFTSNGGTLTYFNRSFHVSSGRVAFDPADGIDPLITASATTTADDPDRNTARNTSGRVTITLRVAGSLDHLNVDLSSDPSYDRQQILGLLLNLPVLGAVRFDQSTGADGSANNGLNLPGGSSNSGAVSVSQEAFSFVNAQFTQSLLAPISSALGGAVGLSDLAINFDQTGGLDLSARRHIFGNVYLFFRDSIGMPTRQSLGIDFEPNDATAVSASIFQEQGVSTLGRSNTTALFTPQQTLPESTSSASGGATTSGVSFSLNRRFP